jgi:hypothetical protein
MKLVIYENSNEPLIYFHLENRLFNVWQEDSFDVQHGVADLLSDYDARRFPRYYTTVTKIKKSDDETHYRVLIGSFRPVKVTEYGMRPYFFGYDIYYLECSIAAQANGSPAMLLVEWRDDDTHDYAYRIADWWQTSPITPLFVSKDEIKTQLKDILPGDTFDHYWRILQHFVDTC